MYNRDGHIRMGDELVMRSMSLEKATLYEIFRLPDAPEAADDLLRRTGNVRVVAGIGAGTAQLARLFAGSRPL